MELTARPRIILLQTVRSIVGSVATMRIREDLIRRLGFTEEEYRDLKLTETPSGLQWDLTKDLPVEIEIGDVARLMIIKKLEEFDKAEKIDENLFELWKLFLD